MFHSDIGCIFLIPNIDRLEIIGPLEGTRGCIDGEIQSILSAKYIMIKEKKQRGEKVHVLSKDRNNHFEGGRDGEITIDLYCDLVLSE